MARKLEDELHELFGRLDFKIRKNKHGNFELVLSPEASTRLADILHEHDTERGKDWGKL